jgi:hypothetical protein
VPCLGASKTMGNPSGLADKACLASLKQRQVLPLPAGPKRKRTCTLYLGLRLPAEERFILL